MISRYCHRRYYIKMFSVSSRGTKGISLIIDFFLSMENQTQDGKRQEWRKEQLKKHRYEAQNFSDKSVSLSFSFFFKGKKIGLFY